MVAIDLGLPGREPESSSPEKPFRQFIVKVHSRCNLSCDYCYVYHHVDQSWRDRPKVMSGRIIATLADRIGEHAAAHELKKIFIVLHGGEPLLAGPAVLEKVVTSIRAQVPEMTQVDVSLQTNGVLIDDEFIDVFSRHRVDVGVSIDGGQDAHDRHRRYADGRPSFHLVEQGLDRLRAHGDIWTGLLCTVDLANEPDRLYEDLIALQPPEIDLLLPLANWVHRPPGRAAGATPYADWLITIFDRWFDAPRRETGIRLFDSILELLLGSSSKTEAIGLDSPYAITIETDGTLEVTDALKTTAPGLGALGMSVHGAAFDDAMRLPGVRATHRVLANLGTGCSICPKVHICGGGQYSHRFDPTGRFTYPSVYCRDLYRLITHIEARMTGAIREREGQR
jgi:uncharacterized protein